MDKLKMKTMDKVDENVERVGLLFPNCVTEAIKGYEDVTACEMVDGELKTVIKQKPIIERVVDFDMLRQELSNVIVEGSEERYQFTWPDKKKSVLLANAPINKTLRPVFADQEKPTGQDSEGNAYASSGSVGKDGTKGGLDSENLYIEGDNLDVLKLLQETYMGKVKMIYIDPPYNTGKDSFLYDDDRSISEQELKERSGLISEDGDRLFGKEYKENNESNGKFHTDWLNMIYPRLKLAKDLLTDDGVIFISIDDNEQANLKKVCDEIFGSANFIAQVIWERAYSPVNLKKHFSESHDYMVCYAKNLESAICNGLPRSEEANDRYNNPDNDPRGTWTSGDLSVGPIVESKVYEIESPSGRRILPPSGYCWRLDKSTFAKYVQDNRIWFGDKGENVPRIKRFLSEVKQGITPMTVWKYTEVGHSQDAAQKLKALFDGKAYFDYPKSVELIKRTLQLYTDKNSLILDFFSGSATTAHAVMQLNAEIGGGGGYSQVYYGATA